LSPPFPGGAIYSGGRRRRVLLSQINVLHALFLRESEMRHGQSFALSYVVSGIEPLVIVGTISLLFSALSKTPAYGTSMLLFIATGVFPIYLFIHTSLRLRQPLNSNVQRMRYPVEQPLDHMAVHAALHVLSSVVVAVLFFAGLYYFLGVYEAVPWDPLTAIEALTAILLLGIAMGIFNSVFAKFVPIWDALWPALARAALHFSGPYFVAAYLQPHIRWYFGLNPIMHGVNWFRHAFYPFYPNQLTDRHYILSCAIGLLTFGLLLEAGTRRYLKEKE
jgi:capsular polysaccharide transport system permease protein